MADSEVWGEWEDTDDDLDDLLLATTQVVEQEEEKRLHELRSQTTVRGAWAADSNMTPNVATHAFDLRRENLRPPAESNAFTVNKPVPTQEYKNPDDAAAKILYLNKQYASEKSNSYKLKTQLVAAQGESNNLRRQVETLNQKQQEDLCGRLQREREDKMRFDQEKKKLQQEISALRTDLRIANDDKARMNMSNRSIGGAMSQCQTRNELNLSKSTLKSPPLAPKHKSDPYLNTPVQQMLASSRSVTHPTTTAGPPDKHIVDKPKVVLKDKGAQADASLEEMDQRLNQVFCVEQGRNEVCISKMENMHSLHHVKILRRQIFEKIQSLIHRDFKYHTKDLMESIAAKAPKEIMARFTRGVEMKTNFPDLIENMFLYGVQVQKRKENEERGDHNQKKYPKLPNVSNDSSRARIINLDKLEDKLEYCFVDSAWMALKEIKDQLKLLLTALNEELRFRLYEYQNLQALWELLSWAKYLWKFIVFEEEFEHIIDSHGKTNWIEELQGWTGLMLKIAWRDFYIPELEQLVRKFSLNILEIIVTTGYFDSSQRRYEILYCILKDTLIKDHLRNEKSVRRCLNIITWSIADNRNILNYLCMNDKNGNNCLAKILGENVLKCFKETECPKQSTSLLLHYFHLLEILMVENTPLFFSKVAPRPNQTSSPDSELYLSSEDDFSSNCVESMDVDTDDMMFTQLACPDKYKFENGSAERAKQFNNVKAASCWINPQEWEIQIDDTSPPEEHVCQCRKILLGNTFIMLYHVVPWWRTSSVINCERLAEQRENIVKEELRKLKEIDEQEKKTCLEKRKEKLDKHLAALHSYVIAVSTEEGFYESQQTAATATLKAEADPDCELLWDAYLKPWNSPERDFFDRRGITETVFDFAVQSGILFMNFCNYHSENIALAAGSEAFNDFSLLVSAVKLHENNPWIKEAQTRFLTEIIKSGEDDSEPMVDTSGDTESDSNLESDYNNDDNYANTGGKVDLEVNDRNNTNYLFIDHFEPVPRPRKKVLDSDFFKKFQCLEQEMRNYD